jgi:hypothetical protein
VVLGELLRPRGRRAFNSAMPGPPADGDDQLHEVGANLVEAILDCVRQLGCFYVFQLGAGEVDHGAQHLSELVSVRSDLIPS